MSTFQDTLNSTEITNRVKLLITRYQSEKPSFEQLQSSFLELLTLINHLGVAVTVAKLSECELNPSDMIAVFLIGVLKGLEISQVENNIPEITTTNILEAWEGVQSLSGFLSL